MNDQPDPHRDHDDRQPSGIKCEVCQLPAPITFGDLHGYEPGVDPNDDGEYHGTSVEQMLAPTEPESGENLPLAIAPTDGWMLVPELYDIDRDPDARDDLYDGVLRPEWDPERMMHCSHASKTELDAWHAQLYTLNALAKVKRDDPGDDQE